MKCSARGDSQTDQQVNKLIALNPMGWLCLWAAGAIAENALHALRAFGRLPVRTELLSLHVEQLRLRDRKPSAPYRMATKEELGRG